jgi:hypothetical protein
VFTAFRVLFVSIENTGVFYANFALNERKHLPNRGISYGCAFSYIGLRGGWRGNCGRKSLEKGCRSLENAEFFIVDLYFYGSGCYPLGRG